MAGNLNLLAENAELVAIIMSIYQSIGNDEINLNMCSDKKFVQNLKSYAREKSRIFKLFGFLNISVKTCLEAGVERLID